MIDSGADVDCTNFRVSVAEYNVIPYNHQVKKQNSWMSHTLPADTYLFSGFEGQNVFIIPSMDLVITRLGFTYAHEFGEDAGLLIGWDHSEFYGNILKCFK